MALPVVMSAKGRPPHSSATALASFGISGSQLRVPSPTFCRNNSHACSHSKTGTLKFLLASIEPHTCSERVVNTNLELLLEVCGDGIPMASRSKPSHTSSNKSKNFFLLKALNMH
ncbi:hypothetical protein ACHQM5_029217 [Ranunculus cassubicifolius]